TTTGDLELAYNRKRRARLRVAKPSHSAAPSKTHNRTKKRSIAGPGTPYLAWLGVTQPDGTIKKGMDPKYRQINKFVEILDSLLRSSPLKDASSVSVLDMGSGKGYLTFATY